MKLLFLLPLLLVFSVPANATSDLHPLDMKLEQKGFSSLIAQEGALADPDSYSCENDEDAEREGGDPVPKEECEG